LPDGAGLLQWTKKQVQIVAEYGYARVSDANQNLARQMISMAEQGVPAKNIYVDRQSGKDFERKAYQAMLKRLRPGDCVILHSLDRLGRDYAAILEQWQFITKDKGADIVVLDMPLLDTREKDRDLTGRLISDIVLQLLSYCSQNERENIRKRQAEGIAAAKARGVALGRPACQAPGNFGDIVQRWEKGEIPFGETLKQCRMSRATFYRRLYAFRRNQNK
jgi:DNA invertase Pin-like site-specific DNA recombinase